MITRFTYFLFLIFFGLSASAQKNLDFERWDINYLGVDEALDWMNVCDASNYGAPQVLYKEVENPANGLASIKLTTRYWKQGKEYQLDTLIGALVQQSNYYQRPMAFEFSYQSFPKKGDEVLVGIQLTTEINNEVLVIGEGFFTTSEKVKDWSRVRVNVNYFSNEAPTNITIMALSSANSTILTGEYGHPKIGSTLLVDDLRLVQPEKVPNLTSID